MAAQALDPSVVSPRDLQATPARQSSTRSKPLALIVFLENVGHVAGLNLPQWAQNVIDWSTEEYAKILLRLYGAYRRYDRVVVLEDAHANGPELADALFRTSRTHRVDLLLLVHGHAGMLVGHRGEKLVGASTFDRLRAAYAADPRVLDLRMVYGLNCHGATLLTTWLDLGAQVANGAVGVNWFPEPSLSVFLRSWLGGMPYSQAVRRSNRSANRIWRRILRAQPGGAHPWLLSSRQVIAGQRDLTIHDA